MELARINRRLMFLSCHLSTHDPTVPNTANKKIYLPTATKTNEQLSFHVIRTLTTHNTTVFYLIYNTNDVKNCNDAEPNLPRERNRTPNTWSE